MTDDTEKLIAVAWIAKYGKHGDLDGDGLSRVSQAEAMSVIRGLLRELEASERRLNAVRKNLDLAEMRVWGSVAHYEDAGYYFAEEIIRLGRASGMPVESQPMISGVGGPEGTSSLVKTESAPVSSCRDCGLRDDHASWVDTVISDETWALISPDTDGRGLLCLACMVSRLERARIRDVPVSIHHRLGVVRNQTEDEAFQAGWRVAEKRIKELGDALEASERQRWKCQGCGAEFPHIRGDEDATKCSKCVEVEILTERLAESERQRREAEEARRAVDDVGADLWTRARAEGFAEAIDRAANHIRVRWDDPLVAEEIEDLLLRVSQEPATPSEPAGTIAPGTPEIEA